MRRSVMLKGGGAIAALLLLAVLAGSASPGFPLAKVPGAVTRKVTEVLRGGGRPAPPAPVERAVAGASAFALGDIPRGYLSMYLAAAPTCPNLAWQVLAGIGKIESDHGRSPAPGVRTGLNRAGCCAGPMQFNLTNGPPSTWDAIGRGGSPYDPADAIPAAARKLCANGLALRADPPDPCPNVLGSPALHLALKRYNNACWYVHEVVTLADRYTAAVRVLPRSSDPFVVALAHNPRLTTTTSHGCDPEPDLASGRLDLRIESLLAALTDRYAIRLSCLRTGHSKYVKGTRRISNHTVWRAVDIDRVDGQPVSPTSTKARQLATWLDRLDGPLRPAEIGSPFTIGHRPYFTDEGHQEHLHIGYSKQQTPG
ncbi:MAG TPA: hypothetical protein VNK73_10745 [Actinomycetota bacterium]|nr:hypothetical protein [Actinomycetota bacterium]